MFKSLLKNKKAQNTAEYALLIALVVAAVIAMQTYAQRALQARVRDASAYMTNQTAGSGPITGSLGNVTQYEPYYLSSQYDVSRDTDEMIDQGINRATTITNNIRTRQSAGFQQSIYNSATVANGI